MKESPFECVRPPRLVIRAAIGGYVCESVPNGRECVVVGGENDLTDHIEECLYCSPDPLKSKKAGNRRK
jgi:hypothetical protein